jgi:hypothetical protein
MIKDYSNSVIYADKVLSNPKTDNVKSDAQIIIARSAMQTGDETKRDQDTLNCLRLPRRISSKPCIMMLILKIKMESLRLQIQQFKKLAKNYSGYRYFGAKV